MKSISFSSIFQFFIIAALVAVAAASTYKTAEYEAPKYEKAAYVSLDY